MSEKKTASVIHQGQVFVKCILPIQIIQELEIVRKIIEEYFLKYWEINIYEYVIYEKL